VLREAGVLLAELGTLVYDMATAFGNYKDNKLVISMSS